jgi:hypothetical protein
LNRLTKRFLYLTFLAALAPFFEPIGSSQDTTGRITGMVYDQSGAVIAGAHITVTDVATQISRRTTSDSAGFYQVLLLPIGNYTVSVDHRGFKSVTTANIKLEINQTLKIDLRMEVGSTTDTVTVESNTGTVETINPTLGSTVSDRAVQDMPLNGRNALDLVALQPGVFPADNPGNGQGNLGTTLAFSVGRGRSDSNTFVLDGGLNNDLLTNGVVYNPNPDSIQEFKVLTSDFTAEYGRSAGGIITEVTKSGTNAFHGSAYDFVRNTLLDANNFFSNLEGDPRQVLHRNQYGGTVGGPIKKDKLFFFSRLPEAAAKRASGRSGGHFTHPRRASGQFLGLAESDRRCQFSASQSILSVQPISRRARNHRPNED